MSEQITSEQIANPPRNGMAVAALILGIVALILSPVVIGALIGVVAIVLGILAVRRPVRRGMAITGIVTGGLSLLLAVMVALLLVLLPLRNGAGGRAWGDAQAAANLRTITNGLEIYSAEHNARFPPHIAHATRALEEITSTGIHLNDPRVNPTPFTLTPRADLNTRIAEVDAHCDFYYAGAGVRESSVGHLSSFIVLYDHPDAGKNRIIAFADGHVEMVPAGSAQLERLVEDANAQREALKLPPLPAGLSGPPPAVP